MAVYVDPLFWPWRGTIWCHMYADTIEELHDMADKIGLRRSWFQDKKHFPHYDLVESKRNMAIRFGAIEQDFYEAADTWDKISDEA